LALDFFFKIMQTLLCAIDIDLSKILKYLLYFNMYECGQPKWDDLHSFKGYSFFLKHFQGSKKHDFPKKFNCEQILLAQV